MQSHNLKYLLLCMKSISLNVEMLPKCNKVKTVVIVSNLQQECS